MCLRRPFKHKLECLYMEGNSCSCSYDESYEYLHARVSMFVSLHTYTKMNIWVCIPIHTLSVYKLYIPIVVHTYKTNHLRAHIQTQTNTYIRIYIHMYMYTYKHTHPHAIAITCNPMCTLPCLCKMNTWSICIRILIRILFAYTSRLMRSYMEHLSPQLQLATIENFIHQRALLICSYLT